MGSVGEEITAQSSFLSSAMEKNMKKIKTCKLYFHHRFLPHNLHFHQAPEKSPQDVYCIAVGDLHLHINSDDLPDVRNSKNTLERLHQALSPETKVTIRVVGQA